MRSVAVRSMTRNEPDDLVWEDADDEDDMSEEEVDEASSRSGSEKDVPERDLVDAFFPRSEVWRAEDAEELELLDRLRSRLFVGGGSLPVSNRHATERSSARVSSTQVHKGMDTEAATDAFMANQNSISQPLSPEKLKRMIDRFRMQEEKKARKRCTKRNEAETREKASLKFAPKLNPKSRQIASHYPDFLERQATLLEYKKQARAYQHQLEEEAIGRDRVEDLHRNVRTPCICGLSRTQNNDVAALMVGNSSPSPVKSSIKASSLHTKACQRFMEMCAAMNQSFIIQRKKEQMKRSIDDMMAFHEEKRQRQQARAQIAQAKEALETTFKPQINATSERLYSNMVRSGRLEREWTERVAKPRKQPSMPKLSFQPTISKRSKQLLQKKHQFSAEAVDDVSDSQNDVFSRLQRSTLQSIHGTSKKSQPSTRGPSPPPAHWNVIQFDESKCGFILQSFELPVAFG